MVRARSGVVSHRESQQRRSYYARIAESLAYEHPAEIEPNEHHRQYVWSHIGIDFDERRVYNSSYVCL
jgi:hypothetical protein